MVSCEGLFPIFAARESCCHAIGRAAAAFPEDKCSTFKERSEL